MSAPDIVIFHYHVRSGGVTSVILLSIQAIAAEMQEVRRIRLVVGEEPDEGLLALIAAIGRSSGGSLRVEVETCPELGYAGSGPQLLGQAGTGRPSGDSGPEAESRRIARLLSERWGGALWWVHNYHLGKNPPFTQALLDIASEYPDQRMLLHIHDLPEAGRFENLRQLHTSVTRPLYPALRNVRYLVINDRDRRLLLDAGLSRELVFLVNNPVSAQPLPAVDPQEVRARLSTHFGRKFPAFDPASPLLFYPVRAIRRKNLLEAGLIASLSPERPNLVVTLPGVSPRELRYSRAVEESFERGAIKGLFGIGERLPAAGLDFPAVAAAADRIVSTSFQEGFGYLFADSLRWGKPLVARSLDTLGGIADLLDPASVRLYDRLLVPLDGGERAALLSAYDRYLDGIRSGLSRPSETREAVRRLVAGSAADFSYLPLEGQLRVVERATDPSYRSELVSMNAGLFDGLERLVAPRPELGEAVAERFGFPRYAQALRGAIASFDRIDSAEGEQRRGETAGRPFGGEVHAKLCVASETPENLRLLLAVE